MDSAAGEEIEAYVFVAALPYSQYFYAGAFLDMKSQSWLTAHVHAFEYFGGVTETLVPDNLKTGITKHRPGDSQVNPAYGELTDHYRTVVVPSRIQTNRVSRVRSAYFHVRSSRRYGITSASTSRI